MQISLQGPIAGAIAGLIGLYLLFGPIESLAYKRTSVTRRAMKRPVPTWMKFFFRGLGLLLLVLAGLLLAPVVRGGAG